MRINVSGRAWINTALIAVLVAVWAVDMLRDDAQEDELAALESRVAELERRLESGDG